MLRDSKETDKNLKSHIRILLNLAQQILIDSIDIHDIIQVLITYNKNMKL